MPEESCSSHTCLGHDLGEQSLYFGNNVLGRIALSQHLTATFLHPYQPLLFCILKMLLFEVTSVDHSSLYSKQLGQADLG